MNCSPAAAALLLLFTTVAPAREVVVGQVVDYSGKFGEASRDYVAGAHVYFDWVNSKGGVNGMKIRHTVVDTDAAGVRARTRELLDDPRVDVLFGFVGDDAVTAAAAERELRDGGVALVAPLAGRPAPSSAIRSIFFTRPGYDAEIRQIVGHFRALQLTRFAIVDTPGAAELAVAEEIRAALLRENLAALGPRTIASDSSGYARDVEAVLALKAQAIIVVADTVPAAEFIKRYRPRDPGAMIVALSTVNHRVMFEILGPRLAHGVMITQVVPNPSLSDTGLQREHLAAIRMFRDEPPSHLTLEGFIGAKVLVEALRRAGNAPTRESIVAALQRMGPVDLKGMIVDLGAPSRLASTHVDITMIRRNGDLLH